MLLAALALTLIPSSAFAFTHVDVMPMDCERVLRDQTVVVRHGKISDVGGAGKIKLPEGVQIVDGQGKWHPKPKLNEMLDAAAAKIAVIDSPSGF